MGRGGAVLFIAFVCVICLFSLAGRYTREPEQHLDAHDAALVDGDRETEDDERLPENKELEERPTLTDREMNGLKKLALFVGHARSCHTFVGSMLNAHPHMHIGVSFNLVSYYIECGSNATREDVLQEMFRSAVLNGNSSRTKEKKGYSLQFDGLYQGTYRDHLDVIGAHRGGGLARLNLKDPTQCKAALAGLRRLTGLPLYFIRVIRNPFDIVATQVLYARREPEEVRALKSELKSSGQQYKDAELVSGKTKDYFDMLQSTEEVLRVADQSMDVHCRDLIANPEAEIQKLCDFFEVECPKEYVERSVAMVFPVESKTHELVEWPAEARDYIRQQVSGDRFPYLIRYMDD